MNIVLLSGGSGRRLWPLSNDVRSKQFIKIFKNQKCKEYESMVQRIFRGLNNIDKGGNIIVATSKSQISELHNQIGNDVTISVEPSRMDTFPAIVLATLYLKYIQNVPDKETVVVCPVDPLVDDTYFESLKRLSVLSDKGTANLTVMGIEPTYPSEKYGYIIPKDRLEVSPVYKFKEKPDVQTAKEYIAKGALWNAGVFAFKIDYLLAKAHKIVDFTDYQDFFNKYSTLPKISFDYAVAENEERIQVLRFNGPWKDLGTWNTLTEAMDETTVGNVTLNEKCTNVHVINTLDIPILCMGIKNTIVSASPDGILITEPEQSSYIKPFVDKFDNLVRFAEKSWGNYQVIDVSDSSLTIKVTMKKGNHMSYHSHERRNEVWTIVSGIGRVLIDGFVREVKPGDVLQMEAGRKHTISAITDLVLIEVQLGKDIDVRDKKKFEINQ